MAHHVANHIRLSPAGDENGDAAFFGGSALTGRNGFRGRAAQNKMPQTDQDRNEIIEAAEQEDERQQAETVSQGEGRFQEHCDVIGAVGHVLTKKVRAARANRTNLKIFLSGKPLHCVNDMRAERSDLAALSQLVMELVGGTLRRHVFTQCELQLLLDLQACRIRKSTKPEILRRYLRAVQQQAAVDASPPLGFAQFFEREQDRLAAQTAERLGRALEASASR